MGGADDLHGDVEGAEAVFDLLQHAAVERAMDGGATKVPAQRRFSSLPVQRQQGEFAVVDAELLEAESAEAGGAQSGEPAGLVGDLREVG